MKYSELYEEQSPDLFNDIERNSLEFIESGNILYRGSKQSRGDRTTIQKVHANRKPTDTNILLHDLFDVAFYEKFNIKARSQSVFTTPDIVFALRYGNASAIIPKGKAVYIFSDKVKDLFHLCSQSLVYLFDEGEIEKISGFTFNDMNEQYNTNIFKMEDSLNRLAKELNSKYPTLSELPSDVFKLLKSLVFHIVDKMDYVMTTNPNDITTEGVEVMLHCKEYYEIGRKSPESYKLEFKHQYMI